MARTAVERAAGGLPSDEVRRLPLVDGGVAELVKRERTRCQRHVRGAMRLVTTTDEAWVGGQAAARGRFDWSGKLRRATKLHKRGGVSLMGCLPPWAGTGGT